MRGMQSARVVWLCLLAVIAGGVAGDYFSEGARAQENGALFSSGKKDASEGSYKLEEWLVVAPPVIEGNQINRLGSESTVVSEKQIQDLNAQDLPQALRMVPGVVISRFNPVGSFGGGEGGSIFIRG